jgi:hypothetical protein
MKNKIFYDWVNFNNLHKDLSFLFEINSNYLLSIFFEYSSENLVEINYAFKEFSKKEKIKNIRDLTTKIMENYKEIKILIDSLLPCKILTRCIILIFNPSFDKGKKVTQKRFGEHFFPSDFDNPIDDILNFSTEIFVQKIFDDADLPDQIIELCNIYNQLINDKKFINLFSIFSHFLYDTKLTNVEFNICLDSIKSKNTAEKYVNY